MVLAYTGKHRLLYPKDFYRIPVTRKKKTRTVHKDYPSFLNVFMNIQTGNKRNFRYGLHWVAKLHRNATQEVYATDRHIGILHLH